VVNLKVVPVHFHLVGDYHANVQRIKVTLAQIEEGMDPELENVLMEAAYVMRDRARMIQSPHIDTKSLWKSIRVEHVKELAVRVRAGGYRVNPKTKKLVNYAKYHEKDYPFMQPAWDYVRGFVQREVEMALRRLANV